MLQAQVLLKEKERTIAAEEHYIPWEFDCRFCRIVLVRRIALLIVLRCTVDNFSVTGRDFDGRVWAGGFLPMAVGSSMAAGLLMAARREGFRRWLLLYLLLHLGDSHSGAGRCKLLVRLMFLLLLVYSSRYPSLIPAEPNFFGFCALKWVRDASLVILGLLVHSD